MLFVDSRGFEVLRDNLKTHLNSQENRYISVLFVDIRGFEVLWDNLKTRSACRMVPERRVSAVGEALGPSVKLPRIHSARAASIDHLLGSTFLSILGLHVIFYNFFLRLSYPGREKMFIKISTQFEVCFEVVSQNLKTTDAHK